MSCDQAIFADHATDASLPSYAVPVEIDRFGRGFQRRSCIREAVRPVLIVVDLVLAQDLPPTTPNRISESHSLRADRFAAR